ncbi:MAG: bifunctional phosphopantothenoylcysteine decarboxylase/phosphopantothenate--cysteine ligase CoaBC [Acidimicrobiales bacterium]
MPGEAGSARVVLGVTGGIAAYKAVEICRRLVEWGAFVSVVMTTDALRFVGAATFSALASEPVHTSTFQDPDPIPHVSLARSADLVLVAPATAHFLGRYAGGMADDLLGALLLATRAPVLLCPAMHAEMWEHPAVRENLATLERRGVNIVAPEHGALAGGDVGTGRLADPPTIVAAALSVIGARGDLAQRRVLVSAGGTREPIDPVRYISNRSSGKQGHAIAQAALRRGAEVTLVTTAEAPVVHHHRLRVLRVETAAQMESAMALESEQADVVVMAAAVADFRPARPASTKLAKRDGIPTLELEEVPDILEMLGARRRGGQVIVGFAAHTGSDLERARAKRLAKGVDLIVENDVSAPGAGFATDTNRVTIVGEQSCQEMPLSSKTQVADAIFDRVLSLLGPRPER